MASDTLWRRAAAIACALAALAGSLPARAQAQPSAADKETSRSLMRQGDAALARGDAAAAMEAYRAAHALMGVPTTGVSLAQAQAAVGLLVEARDTALAIARAGAPGDPDAYVKARAQAAALSASLAARIPSIRIVVTGAAAGADVELAVDGLAVPPAAAGAPRKLNPGTHRVSAKAAGHRDASVEVTLAEAEDRQVTLELAPQAPDTPAAAPAAPSAPSPAPTPPGLPAPAPARGGTSPFVFAGFGLAVAGLGVGAVAGALSLSKTSDIKEQCEGVRCPDSLQSDVDSAGALANVSNVGFALGAVGLGAGIIGLLLSGDGPSAPTGAWLSPAIGPAQAGFSGRF